MMINFEEIYALNEQSLTIVFGSEISTALANRVTGFNQAIMAYPFPGFLTSVPAYTTVTLFYDPIILHKSGLKGSSNYEKVSNYLKALHTKKTKTEVDRKRITIPVCYGNEFGPDLDFVCRHSNLTQKEVIAMHSSVTYLVHMIGFVPGFAYMGGMDKRLSNARKSVPSGSVPAGSVGIAGEQTGIYSLNTPGGWQIIGRTPLRLFNPDSEQATLLKAGDEVIFEPITIEKFNSLS